MYVYMYVYMYIYIDRYMDRYRYRYRYMEIYIYIYIQTIIQEFILSTRSHVCSWGFGKGEGEVGMGALSPRQFYYISPFGYIYLYILFCYIFYSLKQ